MTKSFNQCEIEVGDYFILPQMQHTAIELYYGIVLGFSPAGYPKVAVYKGDGPRGAKLKHMLVRKPENIVLVPDDTVPVTRRVALADELADS